MKRKTLSVTLLIASIFFMLISSCSSARESAKEAYMMEMEPDMAEEGMIRQETAGMAAPAVIKAGDVSDGNGPETGTAARKRIYHGSAALVVDEPDDVRGRVESLTLEKGGYIEQSGASLIVIRIPAADFDPVFRYILTLGRVERQKIDTWDVTDQYLDSSARLDTAVKTRERLYVLLEKSSDPEERARILKEIGRLTEEIEVLKHQLTLLGSHIAFSRISIELIPRLEEGYYQQNIPFGWIRSLSPLHPVSDSLKARVSLEPGDDFAVFEREKIYLAEDAGGSRISVSTVENRPRGDGEFWQRALLHHLAPYYSAADAVTIDVSGSPLYGVEFLSKDREPFHYFAGVLASGGDLHVIELFSPPGGDGLESLYHILKEGAIR